MRRISMTGPTLMLLVLAVAVISSALTLTALCATKPWGDDVARSQALAQEAMRQSECVELRWDTPVVHEWSDCNGTVLGEYTTTLYEYTDDSQSIARLEASEQEVSTLVNWMATDPVMRGHLIRHGVTAEKLDYMATHFEAEPQLKAYLAYHAR